jgi:hypothetical protein
MVISFRSPFFDLLSAAARVDPLALLGKFMILPCLAGMAVATSYASASLADTREATLGIEYLTPTKEDRDIETVNVDFSVLAASVEKLNLSFHLGIAGIYATGSIGAVARHRSV